MKLKLKSHPPARVAMAYVARPRSSIVCALALVSPCVFWLALPGQVRSADERAHAAEEKSLPADEKARPTEEKARSVGEKARPADEKVSITSRPKAHPKKDELKRRDPTIRLDVNEVLVNVSVVTPMGQQVTGLEKEHFKILEEKEEQKITYFGAEDAPLSMGVIFDASGSMGQKLSKSRQAVAQFFKTANPQDEFFLIQFNDRPELAVDFTTKVEEIQNRLTFTQAKGRTALLDAIYMGLKNIKQGKNSKRALLIISDGGDNSSRYTEREIKNLVKEADVQIYAIGIYEPISSRGRTAEEMSGPGLLSEVSEQTGGRQFPVDNLNELPDIAAQIGIVLRNQYVLGYVPANQTKDGKWRRITVKLNQPKGMPTLRVFAKQGYYAPAQ